MLGRLVSTGPPSAFDRASLAFFGQATPLAVFASESGLFPVYFGISIAALVLGFARRSFLPRALFLIGALLVTWKVGDAAKAYFHRVRQTHWLWVHETSSGYASGHAALAVAGYGLLAAFVWTSALPRRERLVLSGALLLWVVTIDWSRLALGAHYATDVIGGTLLGLGIVTLGRALYDPLTLAARPRRRGGR